MTKKDYQAIARAIHGTLAERCGVAIEMRYCEQPFVALSGGATGCPVHGIRAAQPRELCDAREELIRELAGIMAADNPRFSRERFVEACETGRCVGMPR